MSKRLTAAQRTDLLKRYRSRVHSSMRWRDKDGIDALWSKLIDLYRGKHFETQLLSAGEDRIAVNICFATINVIAPSVAVNYPKLVVWARKSEDDTKAGILETVLNYWWRHYKIQPEMNLAVKDYLVIGHGWLKVGWRFVEQQKMVDTEELNEAKGQNPQDSDDGPLTPQDPKEPTANDAESADLEADPEYEVVEDRPFVERVSPFDIFVDPEAKTLASAKWIAQRIVKPYDDVRQDKRYRLKGRVAMKPDRQVNADWVAGQQKSQSEPDDDVRRVTLWEFYDLRMGTMCVFSEMGQEMLLDPIQQPYDFGHPFVMLRNYEIPDAFYPMGDVEALEPLQMELDKTRSQMMNHRKRFNRKWLYDPESFDGNGISALMNDQDNTLVPVLEGSNKPLNEVLIPIPQIPVEPQLYQYAEGVVGDMDRVSGVSDFQKGETPEVRRTATEASMVQDAANARASDKLASVEILVAAVADRVVSLAQQYMTQDQEARLIGTNGYPIWVPYGRKDVQGEFDFEVEAGSTQPQNDTARRQNALQLLQAMTPWAQAGLVNAQELVKYALTYGFQVKNPDKFLAQSAPQGPQEKAPHQTIVETMAYQYAPADIQRQMEQQAGFQPSTMGGSSPGEQALGKIAPQMASAQGQQQAQQQQVAAQVHGANLQHAQHSSKLAHDATMAHQAHEHETHGKVIDHHIAIAEAEHGQQGDQQAQQQAAEQQQMQTVLQGAMQPPEQQGSGGQSGAG